MVAVVDTGMVRNLLNTAVQDRFVLIAAATKVLHRKHSNLVPMLDAELAPSCRREKALQGAPSGRTLALVERRLNDKQLRGSTSSSMSSRPCSGTRLHTDIAARRGNQRPGKGYPVTSW